MDQGPETALRAPPLTPRPWYLGDEGDWVLVKMGVEAPAVQSWSVSRKGPAPPPARETLWVGFRGHPEPGDRLPGRQE